jgi:hypothetical protein
MRKREEVLVLVPAGFRERQSWCNEKPRTWEEVQAAEKEAAERKRLEEDQRAAKEAEDAEAFQKEKDIAEQYYIRTRKKSE